MVYDTAELARNKWNLNAVRPVESFLGSERGSLSLKPAERDVIKEGESYSPSSESVPLPDGLHLPVYRITVEEEGQQERTCSEVTPGAGHSGRPKPGHALNG